ncbi:SPFH domain-containing protein [Demequina aurantiaca]|uniref:SPFH domain-containing protein n=1 Tax=Demequina aurantiaca TaxID=676200 RepID=UPI003D340752
MITDGGRITDVSTEPGYYTYRNDGQPSMFTGSGLASSLIRQSWERVKFGGIPGSQQLAYFVNRREIRDQWFGTPGALPYKDYSLVPAGSTQAPVLRIKARGMYSIRVADPVQFFQNFLPANARFYTFADPAASNQLFNEFITAFQAALQGLSRSTDIASLATHGPELARALTTEAGPEGSWLSRFGIEVVSCAVSAIEYDAASQKLMDKYNQGTMLSGAIGNAYSQTTLADAALAAGETGGGAGMMGVGIGVASVGGGLAAMQQPTGGSSGVSETVPDLVTLLGQLKGMFDQGLITDEQFAAKQAEILGRM